MGNLMTKRPFVDPNLKAQRSGQLFPLELSFKVPEALFGGGDQKLTLNSGLTTFVGPNGAGKTRVMRALKEPLKQATGIIIARFLVAGRSAPLGPVRP
jgi:ABC-type transport system involved in cytochrome bd biosynthesis fused ATPase/permease subunit